MIELNSTDEKILKDAGWELQDNSIVNLTTGCNISGAFLDSFIKDKLEELKEELDDEEDTRELLTDDQIFALEDIDVICSSPYELEDKQGNMITGECALWLKQDILIRHNKRSS
jgi:hypothetical protein